jgi:hypothetical protein
VLLAKPVGVFGSGIAGCAVLEAVEELCSDSVRKVSAL